MRLLLVEDDPVLSRTMARGLENAGHRVELAHTVEEAQHWWAVQPFDAVLLDLNLPDIDGLQVCRAIKAGAPSNVPVLMLTARDSYEDKARGFRDGADDYLSKPFDLREVALRCEALARRRQLHVHQEMRVGPFTLQTRAGRALYRDAPLPLTQTGFKILLLLCREHPHAVSRSALLQALWGSQPPDSDALKSHIYALRKQLELLGGSGAAGMLVTIPQLGYRLAFDAAPSDG